MAEIYKLVGPYALAQTAIVRNELSSPSEVRVALSRLAEELAKRVLEVRYLTDATITTPMRDEIRVRTVRNQVSVVVTTKPDMASFGEAIAAILSPCYLGYMNFHGRRGLAALNTSVRDAQLPSVGTSAVDVLLVGKTTLATGCTAISLTQTAVTTYRPRALCILTVFYSRQGLHDLIQAFPNAEIFLVGEPDDLDHDGMLRPGVGLLESRMIDAKPESP